MKNLFDTTAYNEITQRLQQLTPHAQRQWGKMEVAQMLAHCKVAFYVPLADKPLKPGPLFFRLFGSLVKAGLYNDKPWKKGLPTAPNFVIKDQRNFEEEKKQLTALIDKFYSLGVEKVGNYPHPIFGKFTKAQWGQAMYKHLDHHLRQFNA
ncbi:MAG TPA: DUF1569 domain-containing protein [Ferruginibacter sp.]|nr:DUF1569 domain-containing protein [Ferruginibacter sp.]HMP19837.1 DUF1569 domain-containing protein [Ferruginibacter sp.]